MFGTGCAVALLSCALAVATFVDETCPQSASDRLVGGHGHLIEVEKNVLLGAKFFIRVLKGAMRCILNRRNSKSLVAKWIISHHQSR